MCVQQTLFQLDFGNGPEHETSSGWVSLYKQTGDAGLSDLIPDAESVAVAYDQANEPLRFSNWALDQAMKLTRDVRAKRGEKRQQK